MATLWYVCTRAGYERPIENLLRARGACEAIVWMQNAFELRERLHNEEPGTVSVLVGPLEGTVSEVNLAAALVADGVAQEVTLAMEHPSGSLRSRAARAGIAHVFDLAQVRGHGASLTLGKPVDAHEGAAQEASRPHAPVLTVASGRGGVGKTCVAAICAALAARWGMRVALCDFDLSCGNLAAAFGCAYRSDLALLASAPVFSPEEVAQCGISCSEGVSLWGPCARPEMAETVMPVVGDLIRELARTYDLVICDTSTTCTDAVAQAMQTADRLVLVQDMRPSAVANLARMSALAVRLGVPRTRIVRVENHAPARAWGQPYAPRAEVGLETARAFRVLEGGDEVVELMGGGRVLELVDLDGPFVRSAATFLARVLKELGSLPACEEARVAEEGAQIRKTMIFGRRREAL